jgi:hypothetical protein
VEARNKKIAAKELVIKPSINLEKRLPDERRLF